MASLGYEVSKDDWGNVVGTLRLGPGPTIVLDSHMDTVGVTDPGAWRFDPSGEIAEGRLYGRGAMDMKGPLAAAVHGVGQCKELGAGTLVVCATVAEELVEGPALAHVLEAAEPDLVVICEATSLRLAHGQRGRAEISLDIRGVPTHSSRPELGVNALEAMALAICALRRLPMSKHPTLGPAILVATDVASRPYPALSVVPDRCVATLDRRTLPGETQAAVLAAIRNTCEAAIRPTGARAAAEIALDEFRTYAGQEVVAPNFAPAWYFEPDAAFVRVAQRALAGAGLAGDLCTYAFCTNGSAAAGALSLPTLGFGPGDEERAHRVDEYIELAQLSAGAAGYAALCRGLVEMAAEWA
jgi:putative selenium metabolism hydrolase